MSKVLRSRLELTTLRTYMGGPQSFVLILIVKATGPVIISIKIQEFFVKWSFLNYRLTAKIRKMSKGHT